MLFNSFSFALIFLPIALAGFYVASAIGRWVAKAWLVIASLAFYTYWHPPFTIL
ncbi:MAG: MBOAT family protein, partial [Acetobacteraceae bacterium]|nr:MBOAT family protein [Acetobacteraceae bacterium]